MVLISLSPVSLPSDSKMPPKVWSNQDTDNNHNASNLPGQPM
jgi:hypothetical protein